MKRYRLLLYSTLLSFNISVAQVASTKQQNNQFVYMTNPIQVDVPSQGTIENLLVVISDSAGRTIFLDNRTRFVGTYKRAIDLSQSGKGPYTLCIAKDDGRAYTKFYIK